MTRTRIGLLAIFGLACAGGGFAACGGSEASNVGSGDASTDAGGDTTASETGGDDGGTDSVPGDASDGGPTCAPPSNASQGALCITITPEAIDFIQNDPHFDGKGILAVALYDSASPPNDGGGVVGSPVILPPLDAGTLLDLSQPVPAIRFDGVPPGTVYPRAIFLDDESKQPKNVEPGWWLGGYDFGHGILGAPLQPQTITAGQGTTLVMDLRAVRGMIANVSTSVPPAGNGQGPLSLYVVDRADIAKDAGALVYGLGGAQCANVVADGGATAFAFFVGGGPYWVLADLNDFSLPGNFPPGVMVDIDLSSGTPMIPQADSFDAGHAYIVQQSIVLDFTNPGDAALDDGGSCP